MSNWGRSVALCIALLVGGGVAVAEDAQQAKAETEHPVVALETTLGTMKIELYPEQAPKTVENFLEYVASGFYNGTVFHRVVPSFVIQGGGYTEEMARKETRPPIRNEAARGLPNEQYTISMARTSDPHSATSQFFISLVDNRASLDPQPNDPRRKWGYCAFGRVVEGQAVVDKIGGVQTTVRAGMQDVPATPVVIESAYVVGGESAGADEGVQEK